jgi:hypothetical protein
VTANAGFQLLGVEVSAPARIVGVFIRCNNAKLAERLRVDPKHMAWSIGGRQVCPYPLDYVNGIPAKRSDE